MDRAFCRARACLWMAVCWALATGLAAAAPPQQAWQDAVRAGDEALATGQYALALEQFQQAEREAGQFGAGDARRAETLVRLARVHRAQGDFAKPEALYQQAIEIARRAQGAETPEFARYLHEAGYYFHTRRKYDRAEEYYRSAFAIRVRALGREHAEVAESLSNLGVLYENQALSDKAEMYYKHALAIREKALGPEHPETILTLEHFARLLFKLNRAAEAQPMKERAQEARKRIIEASSTAAGAPEGEIYRSSDPVFPPKLAERTEPDYTEEARIARQEGTVLLQADISPDGRAGNFRLLRSLGLGLDEQAVEAVRQWEFEPARRGQQNVTFRAVLEIQFRVL